MDPDQQLRNLRDFLLVYNRMTEICFQRCTSNFNYRYLTMDEERCTDNCAGKLIRSNHRLMSTYVQLMPKMVQRRMEEMEAKAAENAKAASAGGAERAEIVTPEAPQTFEAPLASSLPPTDPLVPDASPLTPPGLSAATEATGTRPAAQLSSTHTGLPSVPSLPVGSHVDSGSETPSFAPTKAPPLTEHTRVFAPVGSTSESPSGQEKSP